MTKLIVLVSGFLGAFGAVTYYTNGTLGLIAGVVVGMLVLMNF